MSKKLAIILVNWNAFSYTSDCIESLQQMAYTDYDLLVVDNHSADGSGPLLKEKFRNIILISADSNLGFAGGNNLGIQYALEHDYEYLLLLNNDTFVQPDFLEMLIGYMDSHPTTGAIQPLIYCNHNRLLVWNGGSYYNQWLGYSNDLSGYQPLKATNQAIKEVDWISGCAFLTRTAVIRKTGPLAGNMFMYYEDVDLSFRIKKAGFSLVFHPESVIYHIAGVSNKAKTKGKEGFIAPAVHYYNVRNKIWLLKRYTSPKYVITVSIFNFAYLLGMLLYFTARLRLVKLKTVLKAIRDGLNGHIVYEKNS